MYNTTLHRGIGLYATLVSLATQDDTREIALRVLGSIACRSGASEKLSSHFLKGSPTLLDLAVKHSDDALTMSLLSHVFAHTSVDQEQLQRKIDIALLGRTLLKAIRRPDTLPDTYRHVFGCFAFDSYEMWMQRKNLPGFTTLQVALLQSEQLDVRAGAMSIIVKILATPQAEDPSVLKGHGARPRATLACEDGCIKSARIARDLDIDSLPPKLLERLDEYTGESIEIAEIQEARASYTGFSLRHAKKEDLRPLGRDLAYMIYSYRYALPDLLHPADGSVESCYKCHTEQTWPELLRKCANQLYDRTPRQREDIFSADILSWKIRTQECTAKCLFDCCKEFRARHPDVALFYYLPNPDRSGLYAEDFLRMAKKGLMCTDTPEWLRFELLWQASQAAYFAGIQKAIDPHSEDDNGLLFLAAARTDAKKFLDESPPDGLRRASALALYMCATLVLEGPKCDFNDPYIKVCTRLSPVLVIPHHGVQRVLEDIEVNKQLRKHMNYPIPKEHEATMFPHETIRKLTPGAMKEWGDVVRHMETLLAERNVQQCSEEDVDDALTRWVNTFETDETEEARETRKARMAVVHTGSGKIALKLCMWCGGPSAALKKCGGCSNAW